MLVDPVTLDLAPMARGLRRRTGMRAQARAARRRRSRSSTAPARSVGDAIAQLTRGPRSSPDRGAQATAIAAGVHPLAAAARRAERRARATTRSSSEYGDVARAQLVCALQVHVAVGSAEATLAVYNALRGHLPELAALAANAPVLRRPRHRLCVGAAADRRRCSRARACRPRSRRGRRSRRCCAGRATRRRGGSRSARMSSTARSSCACATRRRRSRRRRRSPPTSTRWSPGWPSAATGRRARDAGGSSTTASPPRRHGLDAEFADLETGERRPVRDILRERLETLRAGGRAARLRGASSPGSRSKRERRDPPARSRRSSAVTGWLADRFLAVVRPFSAPLGRAEADHVVRAVAERPQP